MNDCLDVLTSFDLENINKYTRVQRLGKKISKSCSGHIIVRLGSIRYVSGVIKQKAVYHYFVSIKIIQEPQVDLEPELCYTVCFDNKMVDKFIQDYNLSSPPHLDHMSVRKDTGKT